jgi:histidine triad (HIT) family protein
VSGDCVFCKIASGDIPAKAVRREGGVMAIEDIAKQAPIHVIVFPTEHIPSVVDLTERRDGSIAASLFAMAAALGAELDPLGFRIVVNTGDHGGQTVDHVHAHVLAGRTLGWPPG